MEKAINHQERSHALLSPSSADRWMACTPSARLEDQFPDTTSEAAAEGTVAHELAEAMLQYKTKQIKKAQYNKLLQAIKATGFYNEDMDQYISDYADFVLERYAAAQARSKDAALFLEQRLDITAYIPEGFGTSDCVIIADGTMEVIDLKYGKGVRVAAEKNAQMKVYALGALYANDLIYDIDEVMMTIYQPRIDNISTDTISKDELVKWGLEVLKPKAQMAHNGSGEFIVGDHCRFCKARAVCKALADHNLKVAQYNFQNPDILNDEQIVAILKLAPDFKTWLSAVEEYALKQAYEEGKHYEGYKLVEGRSNRKYSDEDKVAETLKAQGYKDEQIYKPKALLNITAMEKAIGKKTFTTLLSEWIIKPAGKPTLVTIDDKRPELNSNEAAQRIFNENPIL